MGETMTTAGIEALLAAAERDHAAATPGPMHVSRIDDDGGGFTYEVVAALREERRAREEAAGEFALACANIVALAKDRDLWRERATAAEAALRRVCDILDERCGIPVDAGEIPDRVALLQRLRGDAEAEAVRLRDDLDAARRDMASLQDASGAIVAEAVRMRDQLRDVREAAEAWNEETPVESRIGRLLAAALATVAGVGASDG